MATSDIEHVLARIRAQMDLDRETEHEVLEEIRSHLEDVVAEAQAQGLNESEALAQAAARFGLEEVGATLQEVLGGWKAGVLVPFVLAAALKSAQGSSTVAMITSAAIVMPLLGPLGLGASGWGPALAVVAIGCGSMTVSHANDSYFWVVSQMAGIPVSTAYRVYTTATGLMGVTGALACLLMAAVLIR